MLALIIILSIVLLPYTLVLIVSLIQDLMLETHFKHKILDKDILKDTLNNIEVIEIETIELKAL